MHSCKPACYKPGVGGAQRHAVGAGGPPRRPAVTHLSAMCVQYKPMPQGVRRQDAVSQGSCCWVQLATAHLADSHYACQRPSLSHAHPHPARGSAHGSVPRASCPLRLFRLCLTWPSGGAACCFSVVALALAGAGGLGDELQLHLCMHVPGPASHRGAHIPTPPTPPANH